MGGGLRYRSDGAMRVMTARRLAVISTALSMLTGLVFVPGAAARELVAGKVVGSPQEVSLTPDNLGIAMWSVPDGTTLISVNREVGGSKVADLAFTDGSTSGGMPGLRVPGAVRDVTFGPDSTVYLTVASPDDQTAGWLLRLGRADSSATVLHTWPVDPVERYRSPYSVEYANGRLFVEALSANTIQSCLPQLEAFDLAGAPVGTFEATSCGGVWQADDGVVFASDVESGGGLFVDPATGQSHRVPFPRPGPIWNIAHGPGGRIAVVTGNGHNRCDTGHVSVIGPSGPPLTRPLHEVFGVANDEQCLVRALTLLDNGAVVLGVDLPGSGAALFMLAPDGSPKWLGTSAPETIRSLHAADGNAFVIVSTSAEACGLPHIEDCGRVHVRIGTDEGVRPPAGFGGNYGDSRTAPVELVSIGRGGVVVVSQRNQCLCSDPDNEYVLDRVSAPDIVRQSWHDPAGESEPSPPPTFKYIALGDSYSAGEGIEPYFDPSNRCHRSRRAYFSKVEQPGVPGRSIYLRARADREKGLEWGFQACSGAVAASLLTEGHHGDPLPQLAVDRTADLNNDWDLPVDESTDLITLTVGGNDVRFAAILEMCYLPWDCTREDVRYKDNLEFCYSGADCTPANFPRSGRLSKLVNLLFAQLRTRLDAAYSQILNQAPDARVMVLGYPQLIPQSAAEQRCGKLIEHQIPRRWANRIGSDGTLGLSIGEQRYIRGATIGLNRITAERVAAASSAIEYVRVDAMFSGHEICGSAGEWINGPSYTAGTGGPGAVDDESFHPTRCGQDAMAALINLRLNAYLRDVAC